MSKPQLSELAEPLSFASEVIKARNELNLTQSQLAASSGLSLSSIKSYESGRNMPAARELRELCQALQVSPNKLLFGKELPFSQSVADALADGESENEAVSRVRTMFLIGMLASNEQQAIFTLAKGIALARHGDAKVKEALIAADVMSGTVRSTMGMLRDSTRGVEPDPERFGTELEAFMDRQGHLPDPKRLPKK